MVPVPHAKAHAYNRYTLHLEAHRYLWLSTYREYRYVKYLVELYRESMPERCAWTRESGAPPPALAEFWPPLADPSHTNKK